jgi:hypothetical protein
VFQVTCEGPDQPEAEQPQQSLQKLNGGDYAKQQYERAEVVASSYKFVFIENDQRDSQGKRVSDETQRTNEPHTSDRGVIISTQQLLDRTIAGFS